MARAKQHYIPGFQWRQMSLNTLKKNLYCFCNDIRMLKEGLWEN